MKWILPAGFEAAIPAFSGADFAGTWKVTYALAASPEPNTIGYMIFDFKINGGEVVGLAHIGVRPGLAHISVWPGLAPIVEGKVDGDHISFVGSRELSSATTW
jgi:hypothetical protein